MRREDTGPSEGQVCTESPLGGRSLLGVMGKGRVSLQDCWGHHDKHPVSVRGHSREKGLPTLHKHPHTSSMISHKATFALSPHLRRSWSQHPLSQEVSSA